MSQQQSDLQPQQDREPAGPRRKPNWLLIGVLAAVVAAAATVGVILLVGDKEFEITGTITVEAGTAAEDVTGAACVTDGGYSDIRTGTQVTIKDETGSVVALGRLGAGTTAEVSSPPNPRATHCVFDLRASDVPEGKEFYTVEVSHRGELRFTRDDLSMPLALTLGN